MISGPGYYESRINKHRRACDLATQLQALTGQKIVIRDGKAVIAMLPVNPGAAYSFWWPSPPWRCKMMVQHEFVSDRPPEEFADLRIEAEGLRDFGVVFDPDNPTNFSLITIWDNLDAARRAAAGGADLVRGATAGKAEPTGAGSLQISPRPTGA